MVLFLGIVQLLSIILVCIYEYKSRYLSVFLWGGILVLFGIPHLLGIITNTSNYNEQVLIKASLFVIMFNGFYFSVKYLFANKILKRNYSSIIANDLIKELKKPKMKRLVKLSFYSLIIGVLALLFYITQNLGSITSASWGNLRNLNDELGFSSLTRYTRYLFLAGAGVALVFLLIKKKVYFLIAASLIVLYVSLTGNRIMVLPLLVSLIIPFIFSQKNNLSIKKIFTFSLLGFASIYILYFLRLFRSYGGVFNLFSELSLMEINYEVFSRLLEGDGELSLRNAFYHFIHFNNDFVNFNSGHTYIRLLFIFIPSFLAGGIKPPDFAISMGSAWRNTSLDSGYSMHPTLYGDVFANFWWFGVLGGILWAFITIMIEKFVWRKNIISRCLLFVLFGVVYIIVARGSVYNGLFIGLAGSIVIYIIYTFNKLVPLIVLKK